MEALSAYIIHWVKFPASFQDSGNDRYSIVFFSHPKKKALLEPVLSQHIRDRKGRGSNKDFNDTTAEQNLQKTLAATYGWKI